MDTSPSLRLSYAGLTDAHHALTKAKIFCKVLCRILIQGRLRPWLECSDCYLLRVSGISLCVPNDIGARP